MNYIKTCVILQSEKDDSTSSSEEEIERTEELSISPEVDSDRVNQIRAETTEMTLDCIVSPR